MDEKPIDDGSGQLEVWRVEDFKLAPWPKVCTAGAAAGAVMRVMPANSSLAASTAFWLHRSNCDVVWETALDPRPAADRMFGAQIGRSVGR